MAAQMIPAILKALDEQERSQSWLAGKIGVSRMSMSRWLREVEPLPDDRAKQIAEVLGIKLTNEGSRRV